MKRALACFGLLAVITALLPGTPVPLGPPRVGAQPPGAGLTAAEKDLWYHLSQGSELYPYRFLRALYIVDDQVPMIDHLARYGLIAQPKSAGNPFGMPIGVTVAPTKDLSFAGVNMVGINCAACHTTALEKNGQTVLIADGGQNLFDIDAFIGDLAVNTLKTIQSPSELFRFVVRLIRENDQPESDGWGPRLTMATGDAVFKGAATLDALAEQGDLEKAVVNRIRLIYAEEMKKPARDLGDGLRVEPPNAKLRPWAEKAKLAVPYVGARLPDDVVGEVANLRQQYWGSMQAHVDEARQIANLTPRADSPLSALGAEVRTRSIAAALANVRDTLDLLRARYEYLSGLVSSRGGMNKTRPGPGRVDAFGAARNTMFPNFPVPLTAPVSYPRLWNIDRISWYHWDNNTTSALERNVGEAIGVGAIYNRQSYVSTVRVDNILRLEALAGKLSPPQWPTAFGAIDQEMAAKGRQIYAALCVSCHEQPAPGSNGRLDDRMYPLPQIGTDRYRADNFAIVLGNGQFVDSLSPLLKRVITTNGGPDDPIMRWRTTRQYGARPLICIWASAPYLHNNSVPTLYDLLLPPAQRPVLFAVGHREYDPVKLGYTIAATSNRFVMNTREIGNDNVGHAGREYGTELSDEERYQLLEYLKSQ